MRTSDHRSINSEDKVRQRIYLDIGHFIYAFSQLEFSIRAILGRHLGLSNDQFDIVTSPYDFRMLCQVVSELYQVGHSDLVAAKKIKKLLDDCQRLNDDRVRVAHGTWSIDAQGASARQVSRQTLRGSFYFDDPQKLASPANRADELKDQVLRLQTIESRPRPAPRRSPSNR